ncbi:hypothetical protein VE03_04216 [Pseudogymnoascus sp. 23342-1-I1]|nr:hypothetical protein VE03_04216 [Pseudogymnoascus sp. 23342-1-I1]
MADAIATQPSPPTTSSHHPPEIPEIPEIPAALCPLCHRFTTDLLRFDFAKQAIYSPPWIQYHPPPNTHPDASSMSDVFRHHACFSDLVISAETCQLCAVLLDIFAPKPDSKRVGWLGLYPWCGWVQGPSRGRFVAGFSEALDDLGFLGRLWLKGSPHILSFCTRGAWGCDMDEGDGEEGKEGEGKGLLRAVPEGGGFGTARAWVRECEEGHKECNSGGGQGVLPRRVVDVGASEADILVLYTSEGVKAPYVTLSHCWGGDIPGKTIKQNIANRCSSGITLSEMPQNFRDAVTITRELGIRYLWIDALCIIQDCTDDWAREAAKMAAIYAGAVVMISALHAPSSTDGILERPRAPLAILDAPYAIQRELRTLAKELEACPLNGRGWCMQERVLSPRVLHFGTQQMFWECRACYLCEDGRRGKEPARWDDGGSILSMWRKEIGAGREGCGRVDWELWLRIVEEYSARRLTDPWDKLPALAGAAEAFRASRGEGRYLAGVWREDLVQSLLWRPYYHHSIGRKVPGPNGLDKCDVLSEPVERRAPSWSWAALDGQIYFQRVTAAGLVILDVEMGVGDDETNQARPEGRLTVQGQMAAVLYHPPDKGKDVGRLTFESDGSPDFTTELRDCVMDVNRGEVCSCWIIAAIGLRSFLVLKMRDDGCFYRVGFCNPSVGPGADPEKLVERTIVLV